MSDAPYVAPNGMTFMRLGDALEAAYFKKIGDGRRPIRLTREGYTDTVIARGGRGPTGWYIKVMGDKIRSSAGGSTLYMGREVK